MKIYASKTILFFSLCATLIGCSPAYYKPTIMNMPNFEEKQEVFLAIDATPSKQTVKLSLQAAYAITNHLAIQGNYMESSNGISYGRESRIRCQVKRNLSFGEYAVGYFTQKNHFETFSIFGGYGLGSVENIYEQNKGKSSADFTKLFIQSSVGFREEDIELVGSFKLANLKYTNQNENYVDANDIENFKALNNSMPILETGWLFRVGYENIKFQCQATTSHLLKRSNPRFEFDWLNLSAGICVQLSTKKKAK
jgi:hypothetical protein